MKQTESWLWPLSVLQMKERGNREPKLVLVIKIFIPSVICVLMVQNQNQLNVID